MYSKHDLYDCSIRVYESLGYLGLCSIDCGFEMSNDLLMIGCAEDSGSGDNDIAT